MAKIEKIIAKMRRAPNAVRFDDVVKVCGHFFGEPRNNGTSHKVYQTPWSGDPRVNIQESKGGTAKGYQVGQVLKAIKKMEEKQ